SYVDVVPASVIAWVLGWPVEDARRMYRWTVEICDRAMEMRPGTGNSSKDIHPLFAAYVEDKIAERRRRPEADWPDDGLTRFLTSEVDGERLSTAFVRTNMQFLLGAGAETTRDMIGGLLYQLARDPELYARVRLDRGLIPGAIEEALRVYSPTQFMVRRCVAPIEIDGQPLAAGDQVFIGLASANRDESLFPDPDRFDVDRANAAEHVAFGAGPHVCPGASLARLEAGIAVGAFLDRFERAELVSDEFEPLHTPMFYGPSRVLMRLTPA
ncbi:MAG: cytochrome P450, partial [Proteobacteria bacterium]|nr:cytochrome P450 [Pseudomonadota bacterium]